MSASAERGRPRFTMGIGQRYDSIYLRDGTVAVDGYQVDYPLPPRPEVPAPDRRRAAGERAYIPPAATLSTGTCRSTIHATRSIC